MLKSYGWVGWGGVGGVGGPCDFSVSPSPFRLDFGTLDFGTSDLGLTISWLNMLYLIINQSYGKIFEIFSNTFIAASWMGHRRKSKLEETKKNPESSKIMHIGTCGDFI